MDYKKFGVGEVRRVSDNDLSRFLPTEKRFAISAKYGATAAAGFERNELIAQPATFHSLVVKRAVVIELHARVQRRLAERRV